MKGKRYLARYEPLVVMCVFGAILIIAIGFLIIMILNDQDRKIAIAGICLFVLLLVIEFILYLPQLPFSTITFYEKEFCYQKHLFGKKEWMAYEDIELLNIDFCNYPIGISGARVPASIEVIYKYVTLYRINITYKVVAEFLKHIEKKRIHVNFDSLWTFRKKYRELLYDYLTIWKKIELEQKLGKKHKR